MPNILNFYTNLEDLTLSNTACHWEWKAKSFQKQLASYSNQNLIWILPEAQTAGLSLATVCKDILSITSENAIFLKSGDKFYILTPLSRWMNFTTGFKIIDLLGVKPETDLKMSVYLCGNRWSEDLQ